MTLKPILKKDVLNLEVGSRSIMTAKVAKLEITKDMDNMVTVNTMTNSYFCPVGFYVILDNGYCFYTPKHFQYSEMGIQGITNSIYKKDNKKSNWGDVTEIKIETIDAFYGKQTDHFNEIIPSFNVGDEIKIKGTVQPQKRLNRVVLMNVN